MSVAAAVQQETRYSWEKNYPEGRRWDAPIDVAPVTKILDDAARRFADRPAIDFEGECLTYRQVDALAHKIAAGLQKIGVKKGVKVGLFLPNTIYSIVMFYGILRAGGTVVNNNPLYIEHELIMQASDSETKFFVTLDTKSLMEKARNVQKETGIEKLIVCPAAGHILPGDEQADVPADGTCILYQDLIDNDGQYDAVSIDPYEDVALLQYTGGTTGIPKGAMLTHANIYANTHQTALWYGDAVAPGQDRQVGVLPLFHVFAMLVVMNLSFWFGMEILLFQKFDLDTFVPALKKKPPTFFPSVPTIYNAVLSDPRTDGLDLGGVKFCMSGGAPLPGEVRDGFAEKTGGKIGEAYGLTETSPVATCNPVQGKNKLGSIGLPVPGTVIEIVSLEDETTVLPPGEKGEVCISGPQVMKGYYKKPQATDEMVRNGRLYSGDIGYIDDEGYVYIVDRKKDMVIVNGYNVYPRQIEEAIYLHPAVEECVVAGVPDEKRGETVCAWVKPLDGENITEDELHVFLKDKVSPIQKPRKIIIRNEPLPKTAVGKLSRKLMRAEEGAA